MEKMLDIHEAMLKLVEAHEGVDAALGYVTEDDFDAFIVAAKAVVQAWKSVPRPDTISVRMTDRELEMISVAAGFYAMSTSGKEDWQESIREEYYALAKRFTLLQGDFREQVKTTAVDRAVGRDLSAVTAVVGGQIVEQKVIGNAEEIRTLDGKHVGIVVRKDTLLPLLVLLQKFVKCIEQTMPGGPSTVVRPDNYEATFRTRGFTPMDFNTLKSLAWTVGTDLADEIAKTPAIPQMRGPGRRTLPAKVPPREKIKQALVERLTDLASESGLHRYRGVDDLTPAALSFVRDHDVDPAHDYVMVQRGWVSVEDGGEWNADMLRAYLIDKFGESEGLLDYVKAIESAVKMEKK